MILPWFISWIVCNSTTLIDHGAFLGLSDWGIAMIVCLVLL